MNETERISEYVDTGEKIIMHTRQKRWVPGGSPVTPDTIFVTVKKIIIRNPMMLGLRETVQYYNIQDIINISHRKGYFSSALHITAPGMGTAAQRPENRDGIISGIDGNDAIRIVQLVRERQNE